MTDRWNEFPTIIFSAIVLHEIDMQIIFMIECKSEDLILNWKFGGKAITSYYNFYFI